MKKNKSFSCGFLDSVTGKYEFSGACDLDKCPINKEKDLKKD